MNFILYSGKCALYTKSLLIEAKSIRSSFRLDNLFHLLKFVRCIWFVRSLKAFDTQQQLSGKFFMFLRHSIQMWAMFRNWFYFWSASFLSPSQMAQDSNHITRKQIGDYYFFFNQQLGRGTFATVSVSYFDLGRVLIAFVLGILLPIGLSRI